MNRNEMNTLLMIATAPVFDLDAPIDYEVTAKAHETANVRRWKNGRNWAAYDANGELIAVTVYKKGAREIVRRLTATNP